MDYLRQYVIPFGGLAAGIHQFDFEIGEKFFESIEYSELTTGFVKVLVDMEKDDRMLRFDFNFEGYVKVACDHCGEDFDLPLSGHDQLYIKFGETYHEEDDNVLIIPHSDHQINVSHFLYEMIILSLPYRRVHPDDENGNSTCDPEQILKIENYLTEKDVDPRWDKLRELLGEN